MQYDNEKFDLLVRSMMQDAEEPVSPRVWESVSAGLDSRKRRPVFVWIAAGLAAAAALVLGVVLPGTHNSNLPIHIDAVSLVSPGPDAPTPDDGDGMTDLLTPMTADLLADNTAPAAGTPAGRTVRQTGETAGCRSVSPAAVDGPLPAEEEAMTLSVAVQEETAGYQDREENRYATAAALRDDTADDADGMQGDPFARMEWEDAHERQAVRVSVAFGGSMESNGDPSTPSSFQALRAPANQKISHTVIEQTGVTSIYAIPVSAGLNVRIGTGGRWAFGTGLTWTMLQRNFYGNFRQNGSEPVYSEIHNTLHYVGIPVNAYYSLLQGSRLSLYGFAGGSVEKAVSNQFRAIGHSELVHKESVNGVQFSVAAGFGVQFQLASRLGLYIDPSLRWYVPGSQPRSIRTQQPLMMDFEVGLRFDI